MKRQLIGAAIGITAGILVGESLGVWVSRPPIHFTSLTVLNSSFHAGDGIRVQRQIDTPPNCIPRVTRSIIFPPDEFSHGKPVAQILTDSPAPRGTDPIVPTTPRMHLGCGDYVEEMAAMGCGPFSGFFTALSARSVPVRVCVLQPLPLDTR